MTPSFVPVGALFGQDSMYYIPKYQRAYAWEEDSIEDFFLDTKKCYEKRKAGTPIEHFFGGIICVGYKVTGTLNKFKFELIDGQQRLTTYTLLAKAIIDIYKLLHAECTSANDQVNASIINDRINNLEKRFIKFTQEVNRIITEVPVLELSRSDNDFYRTLINGNPINQDRVSHQRLNSALTKLIEQTTDLISDPILVNKIDNLQLVEQIIDNDFSILHMTTDSQDSAYRLFQVINDRGLSLSESDLLRAKTLELLESDSSKQDAVENIWNNILVEHHNDTANFLTWIYESYNGKRVKKSEIYDEYIKTRFKENSTSQEIYNEMIELEKEIKICRKIIKSEWLYPNKKPVFKWDRNKLRLLIEDLGHTLAYPLLVSASLLNHKQFSEIVHMVEKTFFRYKLICNKHVTPLKQLYYEQSEEIRNNPSSYDTDTLKNKLNILIDTKANDNTFKSHLETLEYQPGGNNKVLRYFLLTIEYYYECYKHNGTPTRTCIDKSRVYDFSDTSIEHIYPRNATETNQVANIEPLKNSLGNLCIMDPNQNSTADNDVFNDKKAIYQITTVKMLQELAQKPDWTKTDIEYSKTNMINMALKIFRA